MNQFQKLFGLRLALMLPGASLAGIEREEGQTLAEYALILALIAILAVAALVFLGGDITGLFSHVGNNI
jgi:pilus assembly protein Flp/PilA